jgi:NAD(P)-dependent dehydrogenase (short-subunit alcohol dehydrogenase family)
MKNLHDKVVVITGAASGIGRATALAFGRAGARLHLVDIAAQGLEETVRLVRELGRPATAHIANCTDGAAMQALASAVYAAEGHVDILHNNAGVVTGGPLEETPLEDWRWVIETNLFGVINGVHAFVPRMIAGKRGGHVINTASMAGLVAFPQVPAYCASKFGVVGLSESLAAELAAHRIDVTVICPGMVSTNLLRGSRLDIPAYWMERLQRGFASLGADPDHIARLILRAVRHRRFLVVPAKEMYALWLLKRASTSAYVGLARLLTAGAMRIASRVGCVSNNAPDPSHVSPAGSPAATRQ